MAGISVEVASLCLALVLLVNDVTLVWLDTAPHGQRNKLLVSACQACIFIWHSLTALLPHTFLALSSNPTI